MNFSAAPVDWNITNDMVKSPLWDYAGQTKEIFKCPADKATVQVDGVRRPRVRSNSMSQTFGRGTWLPSPTYKIYHKEAEIDPQGPSRTWILIDEHPDSINDAAFAVQMVEAHNVAAARIIDWLMTSSTPLESLNCETWCEQIKFRFGGSSGSRILEARRLGRNGHNS